MNIEYCEHCKNKIKKCKICNKILDDKRKGLICYECYKIKHNEKQRKGGKYYKYIKKIDQEGYKEYLESKKINQ